MTTFTCFDTSAAMWICKYFPLLSHHSASDITRQSPLHTYYNISETHAKIKTQNVFFSPDNLHILSYHTMEHLDGLKMQRVHKSLKVNVVKFCLKVAEGS